ncbi:hypothetical protein [Prosthecodimorpha staleyi]|uniref:HEPN domain-containing protein n=1 Tax=Prosthecodimorpha staleyi TaxID=2840188 RepID=A0A947GEW4_9HYPH|nr:hypothetical protein [Prosthecodimorpha staleyi]MBT9292457.1 hypothetical protein [Prosthecodimorpha staleyi]
MNSLHILEAARDLALKKGPPRQADLRRAVSSAYYALFHALCRSNADQLVGSGKRHSEAWLRVYRALDHTKARDELRRATTRALSQEVDQISTAFIQLQEERHAADYDPRPFRLSRNDVFSLVMTALQATIQVRNLDPNLRTELATLLLLKSRS